jgi:uncharacterized membrane protein YqjE
MCDNVFDKWLIPSKYDKPGTATLKGEETRKQVKKLLAVRVLVGLVLCDISLTYISLERFNGIELNHLYPIFGTTVLFLIFKAIITAFGLLVLFIMYDKHRITVQHAYTTLIIIYSCVIVWNVNQLIGVII